MQAMLFFLLALFSSQDSRIVYDTPSQIFSGVSPEIVMVPKTATEATYRFAAYVETQRGEGCEYDTTVDFVPNFIRPGLYDGTHRHRTTIRKDGSRVEDAEIPTSVFRVKAGTAISYHVEYMIGGNCKTRPTYQIFPLLELVSR